jgi:hypothetical protein
MTTIRNRGISGQTPIENHSGGCSEQTTMMLTSEQQEDSVQLVEYQYLETRSNSVKQRKTPLSDNKVYQGRRK